MKHPIISVIHLHVVLMLNVMMDYVHAYRNIKEIPTKDVDPNVF